jgi:hypothetical protein
VIDVDYSSGAITNAINHWLNVSRPEGSDVYGGGDAGTEIAKLLSNLPLVFHKTIQY